MNIFFLDRDPVKAAEYHCDKHVVKMVLETAQLLSTAHHLADKVPPRNIFEETHKNHPCAVWVRRSLGNYRWTWRLGIALCEEYTLRYKKVHAIREMYDRLFPSPVLHGKFYDPPQCVAEECKKPDTVAAYRHYYENYKGHLLLYTNQAMPMWLIHDAPKVVSILG